MEDKAKAMNEYQISINNLRDYKEYIAEYELSELSLERMQKDLDTLEELACKETPIELERYKHEICPKCCQEVAISVPDSTGFSDYWLDRCRCGQRIDWSETDV